MEVNHLVLLNLPTYYRPRPKRTHLRPSDSLRRHKSEREDQSLFNTYSYNHKDNHTSKRLFPNKNRDDYDEDYDWINRAIADLHREHQNHFIKEQRIEASQTDFSYVEFERERMKKGLIKLTHCFQSYDKMVEQEYYRMCFNAWKTKWIPTQYVLDCFSGIYKVNLMKKLFNSWRSITLNKK